MVQRLQSIMIPWRWLASLFMNQSYAKQSYCLRQDATERATDLQNSNNKNLLHKGTLTLRSTSGKIICGELLAET